MKPIIPKFLAQLLWQISAFGFVVLDEKDKSTSDPKADKCSYCLSGCEPRGNHCNFCGVVSVNKLG
ncbi:hypothetical protein [Mannheimia granulomatis]|uniref:hypothetical protein n=1 Tax=Mannheimia granulomatis TaxID=85402 RepID=UPI003B640F91